MSEYQIAVYIVLALLCAAALCWGIVKERRYRQLKKRWEQAEAEEKSRREQDMILESMLPAGLLKLLENEKPGPLQIGEEKKLKAAVLSFNVSGFPEMIRSRTPAEIFGFVNDVLGEVVPQVLFQEGEIDRYDKAGLTAFYMEEPERALRSAVSVCEALKRKQADYTYSLGLSYGDIMVGAAGHQKRMGVLTISETTGIADFLQAAAVKYGARILLTGNFKQQVPEFEKSYNSRYLGKLYLQAAGVMEDLYDVYDGDTPEDKNGKRRSRLMFEQGVELFQDHRFYDARLHFIEVLKANRMDRAAKEYLYLCNRYLETEQQAQKAPVYLEVF